MFTVSLRKVRIVCPGGLYAEEAILHNVFETDLDVFYAFRAAEHFVDYTVMQALIKTAFEGDVRTLESLCLQIHAAVKIHFPFAERIRVCIRKMNPPMSGQIDCAQVCFEQ